MFHHPHAVVTHPTVRLDRGALETIYVIKTKLALTPDDPDFDQKAFDDLIEAARAYLESNPHYDSIRVDRISEN